VAIAGAAAPAVTVNGVGVEPSAGSVVAKIAMSGLALTTVANAGTISVIVRSSATDPATLDFSLGGATSAAVVCNGFIL